MLEKLRDMGMTATIGLQVQLMLDRAKVLANYERDEVAAKTTHEKIAALAEEIRRRDRARLKISLDPASKRR